MESLWRKKVNSFTLVAHTDPTTVVGVLQQSEQKREYFIFPLFNINNVYCRAYLYERQGCKLSIS